MDWSDQMVEAQSSSHKPFISNLRFFLTKLKSHPPLQTKFLLWVTHSHLFNSTPTPQPCHLPLTSLMNSRKAMEILKCRITYKLFPVWFLETLWVYQNIHFDGILWITESPIASLVWTSLWLKKKKKMRQQCELLWGNGHYKRKMVLFSNTQEIH